MDRLHAINFLRELADDLERDLNKHQYKGIDPAEATDEQLAWAKQMGRSEVVREIEAARASGRDADRDDVGDGAGGAGGGDGGTPAAQQKDLEVMTADELRAELKVAELPTSGNKDELKARVGAHRAQAAQ